MSNNLIQAPLAVPEHSPFDWVEIKGLPHLTDGLSIDQRQKKLYRVIDSQKVHSLHRMFANLEPTKEAIASFANNWGNLGGQLEQSIQLPGLYGFFSGTSLPTWESEIDAVRRTLDGKMNQEMTIINANLRDNTSARLLWSSDEKKERSIHIVPANLIGVIWLQVAQTLSGEHSHQRCEAPRNKGRCENWFLIKGGQEQHYCSPACRVRANRERNKS
jgi:hypothetical protein